ncbi:creatininase family protein [Lachnoclostridium phytofermentans]|uniref:Creatininase n=1 Tax=Lachnoclostridium phytofermentans (strain ATCC 700394 / DSM 18823 / ISDg) TaxID=357809 RepID=A9KRU4_LACP7|nr:creatininase family protein [Lachnoclostridium phytofermentans]ABX43588.1 Creatininase [Lachnoclostridium phytofermentans ISDg]
MKLSDRTYKEVKDYLYTNKNLIIPVGTCEQHGPHLPLNNDTLCAEYFAEELSNATGCLVAPTINYGVNLPCDISFTGTTTISKDTLKNIITEIVDWWKKQGFENFFIITFHGDPFHIDTLCNISENVYLIEAYEIDYTGILDKQSTMRHACEAETSVALWLYPEKVRTMLMEESDIVFDDFREYLFHENCEKPDGYIGCLGYPKSASAEKGKILVEKMKDWVISEYYKAILKE